MRNSGFDDRGAEGFSGSVIQNYWKRSCIVPPIVAITSYAPAHLYPFVALLRELRSLRHATRLLVFTEVKRKINVDGIPIKQIEWPAGDRNDSNNLSKFARFGAPIAGTVSEYIKRERPSLLLVDPMLWGAMVAAEAARYPWCAVSHNPCTISGLGDDVRGPGLVQKDSLFGSLQRRLVAAHLSRTQRPATDHVNSVRRDFRVREISTLFEMYQNAPLTIAATATPFEYSRSDWPSTYLFVGPLIWEPTLPVPRWIKSLDDRPVILIADTSIPRHKDAPEWLSSAVAALGDGPFQVIVTASGLVPNDVPRNVRVEHFVPHRQILPFTDCVVCHGGSGITHKALAYGVPVLAIPDGYDRFEVGRRVEAAGAGVMLRASSVTVPRLRRAVDTARTMREGARRVSAAFKAAPGVSGAAAAVQELLSPH